MATINMTLSLKKTVANLDAATIAAIISWVQVNVKDKLTPDMDIVITYTIVP